MSVAAALVLRSGDESRLSSLVRSSTVEAGLAQRARIVLLAAQGVPNAEIGRRVGVSRPTVIQWRNRYEAGGISALGDLDRSGRPPVIDDVAVVVATLQAPPEALGVTHWSARLLGKQLGISFASVARIWREWNLQPWRRETFKFSTDPELDAKIRDVVGLVFEPPRQGGRGLYRRKIADPGAGPDRADPTDPPRAARESHPRLRAPRHYHLVRGPGGGDREGHRRLPPAPHATPSSWRSSNRSPRPIRGCRCTSWPTTTPPTNTRPFKPGWPSTRECRCISPRPLDRG